MKMMSKLLNSLGRVWNVAPKVFGAMTLQCDSGAHTFITIDTQQLVFHSTPFRRDMPSKQVVLLDDYSISDLISVINSLGYSVSLTAETTARGYGSRKATVLMPIENIPIMGAILEAFTSPLWQLLYPIARLLEEADYDTDNAIRQMYTSSTSGTWLDYWATFFKVERLIGEEDVQFQKRVFLSLMRMKTNNIAIQELLKYTTNGSAEVFNYAPAQFGVTVNPQYMVSGEDIHQIVRSAKGAGIDYFIQYLSSEEEDYKAYFKDTNGVAFEQSDALSSTAVHTFSELPYIYGYDRTQMFRVGVTKLGVGSKKILPKRLQESLSMELKVNGVVIKTM